MKTYVRSGWNWCKDHIYIWIILFLYQLLWGFFLYRFVDGIVTPILRRYPDPAPTEMSKQLFLTESQFHLMKTNDYMPYFWALIGFIAIHLLLTPFIHAGVFHAMSRPKQQGLAFFQGIKLVWKPMLVLYLLEVLLITVPAIWFVPYTANALSTSNSLASLLMAIAPFAIAWLIGGWLVHQLFLFLNFGAASDTPLIRSVTAGTRRLLPILGLSLIFIGTTIGVGILSTSAAAMFTGITALIIQQALPAIMTMLKMWGLSARHAVWQEAEQQMK
ncbi:carbamoyl transferase [Paenibacillus alvei]|uniref:carbamoyl transferase n=1 Tax=Paenibacillus alvei TaxID=44250 RepID=UPI0013DC44CD|nr:carbamoyl transferase [Paenibacillus alvei]NEZ43617.1 carbamoyl transferase [Paenibacillus alvei]